jgi:hypothetical protein
MHRQHSQLPDHAFKLQTNIIEGLCKLVKAQPGTR